MIKVSSCWHYLGRLKSIAVQLCLLIPVSLEAQSQNGVRYEDLKFETLAFDQPSSEVHTIMEQVKVLFLEDHSLPLVSLFARFRGGTSHFSREEQGAVTAVPMLLRSGGTTQLSPDSINTLLEHYAINVSFGRDGKSSFSSLNTLTDFLDESLSIWELLLTQPRFSREMVQVWQNQELDYLRRSERDPNTMAIRTFNQLMFGDHPTGWTLRPEDLELQHLEPEALRMIHRKIFCQENLILGVTGDTTWPDILPKIHKLIASIPPCKTNLKKIIPRAPQRSISREISFTSQKSIVLVSSILVFLMMCLEHSEKVLQREEEEGGGGGSRRTKSENHSQRFGKTNANKGTKSRL